MTVLYVDGGCTGNGQRDLSKRRMVAVVTDADGSVLCDVAADGGSNNIAELWAVCSALEWCVQQGVTAVRVLTDSRNNLSWVYGKTVGKDINDRASVLALKEAITRYREHVQLDLIWVGRSVNKAGHVIEQRYGL
jgi:RNase H